MKNKILIPADVPANMQETFIKNYNLLTHSTGNAFIFACDHKIEHLNQDFFGKNIPEEVNNPEYLFQIASQIKIGAIATQMGLIERYGAQYPEINYLVKLNSKSNLVPTIAKEPLSENIWTIQDVLDLKRNSNLKIIAVGYTIYLGSEFEHIMLRQATQMITQAHQNGLIAIIWMYPRGKSIKNETDSQLVAGGAGVANALGADFVKIKAPDYIEDLKFVIQAAGNTRVIIAGGEHKDEKAFLQDLFIQMQQGASGCAVGRNIFQKPLAQAIEFSEKIAAIVYGNQI